MKKLAVITGASQGIGRAVAEYLAELNYKVILLARNEILLKEVCDSIKVAGGEAAYYAVDISSAIEVKKCIDDIVARYKTIDLLFNNAAILLHGTTDISDEDIEKLLHINLHGAIYIAKHVANQMKKQQHGYIMNVASLGGKIAASFAGIYAASKFGLSGFSEALAKEMSLYGVKVTNICPAMTATQMTSGRGFQQKDMLTVSDITKTVGYLLSLSKNAVPFEILIQCLPFVEKTTRATHAAYDLKAKD